MPNGPSRKKPASRSSRVPKTLGASKLGTQSQSIAPSGATRALVWQSERKAYSAIGGKGDGAAALCGADWSLGIAVPAIGRVCGRPAVLASPHREDAPGCPGWSHPRMLRPLALVLTMLVLPAA